MTSTAVSCIKDSVNKKLKTSKHWIMYQSKVFVKNIRTLLTYTYKSLIMYMIVSLFPRINVISLKEIGIIKNYEFFTSLYFYQYSVTSW